jgi:hypothetical protein
MGGRCRCVTGFGLGDVRRARWTDRIGYAVNQGTISGEKELLQSIKMCVRQAKTVFSVVFPITRQSHAKSSAHPIGVARTDGDSRL